MAASEGQIECLKILLELKADTRVIDNRNQTPLDLARLWGHRTCAKLLSASIWQKDKNDINAHFSLVRKLKTQDVLKEIEQAHHVQFDTREEAEKKFDTWLTNQGFAKANEENSGKLKRRVSSADANKTKKKKNQDILIIGKKKIQLISLV
jgi:ankyrin repeat protein